MKRKSNMHYAVAFMDGENNELWIKDIQKFYLAKQYAEMLGGTVFLQHPEHRITDAIWPKRLPVFTWTDMNDCLLRLARLKKDQPQPMFNYTVYCGDYAGEFTWELEYSGKDREKAKKAYKDAKDWLGYAKVEIEVLGRKEQKPEPEDDLGIDECFLDNPPCYEAGINDKVCASCEYEGCLIHPCKC